jgi:hypothetical protein
MQKQFDVISPSGQKARLIIMVRFPNPASNSKPGASRVNSRLMAILRITKCK